MAEATLSSNTRSRYLVTCAGPLASKAGDKLLVVVLDDSMIVLKKPKSFAGAIKGMGKGLYPADYLKKERESWE